MALASYNDLVSSVANWLHRTDLATAIGDFVTLAESRIYQGCVDPAQPTPPLRVTAMETQVSGTTLTLPTDCIEIRKIQVDSGVRMHILDYATRDRVTKAQREPGIPRYYTIEAGSLIIAPALDGTCPVTMTYMRRFPALGPNQQTNWLLTNAPNVYLYGTLIESAPYLHDDTRTAVWYRAFADAVAAVQAADDRLRYAGGALRMRA